MDLIKRKIKIVTTTGTTTGCTGSCYVIVPYSGTGVTYNTNLLLSANATEWGFFDVIDDPLATGATGVTITPISYTVTGTTTSSRLSELRKFSTSGTLSQLYFTSTDSSSDGVNTGLTTTGVTASTYVYYLSCITYLDQVTTGTTETSFSFVSSGYSSPVFVNLPYIKNENEQNIISRPLVDNDVFIIRDENSAFENNYRLRDIGNLTELTYYAGGAHFNIVENT